MSGAKRDRRAAPELRALVDLFYAIPDQLGQFRQVTSQELAPVERRLLDHDEHMTVTVESHHGSPVDVRVIDRHVTPTHYARKILLTRQSDQRVVQFGLFRLNLSTVSEDVRREILAESQPLGRILIQHDILRNVRLLALWKVEPGEELCRYFELAQPTTCYGRTALIYCNRLPAVELLEIVAPSEERRSAS